MNRTIRFATPWVNGLLDEVYPQSMSESRLLEALVDEWKRFALDADDSLQPSDLLQVVLRELEYRHKIVSVDNAQWRSYSARSTSKGNPRPPENSLAREATLKHISPAAAKVDAWLRARTFKPIVAADNKELGEIFREVATRYRAASPQDRLTIGDKVERDPVLARKVKERRGYKCQVCGPNQAGVFVTFDGEPYVEAHHMDPLAAGGPDIEANMLVLCVTCHKKFHFIKGERRVDRAGDTLYVTLGDRQVTISRYQERTWRWENGLVETLSLEDLT